MTSPNNVTIRRMNERINRRDFLKLGIASLLGVAVGKAELERLSVPLEGDVEQALQFFQQNGYYTHNFALDNVSFTFLGVEHTKARYRSNRKMIQSMILRSDLLITEGRPVDLTTREKLAGILGDGFSSQMFTDAAQAGSLVITPEPRFGWEDTINDLPLALFWAQVGSSILQRKADVGTAVNLATLFSLSSYLRYHDQGVVLPRPREAFQPATIEQQIVSSGIDDAAIFDPFFHSNIRLARTIRQVAKHPTMMGRKVLVVYGFAHLFPTLDLIDNPSLMQIVAGTAWDVVGVETKAYMPEPQLRTWKEVPYLYS